MRDSFDLTTPEGLEQAASLAKKLSPLLMSVNPLFAVAYAGHKLVKGVTKTTSIEAQSKAAVDIIKAGKENGAKRIKVTLDQKAGVNLSVPVEGVNISAMVGANGKMTLEVEY